MHKNEAKLAAILRAHCDTTAYGTPRVDIEWFLLAILIGISVFELYLIKLCIFQPTWQYYILLCLVAQYGIYLTFHMFHECTHRTIKSGALLENLYFGVCAFHGIFGCETTLPYYTMGHLQHHRHNLSSSLYDFISEPWWHGKDADVLFFGFTEKNPFHTDAVPIQLLSAMKYVLNSTPVLVVLSIVLTIGEIFKKGLTEMSAITLAYLAVRATFLTLIFQEHYAFFIIYYGAFVFPMTNLSLLALYIPMTHPERPSRETDSVKWCLEQKEYFGEPYPTYTPPFTTWVHNWIWLGLTFHIEHHCFPRTPWYNLHLVHKDIKHVLTCQPSGIFKADPTK